MKKGLTRPDEERVAKGAKETYEDLTKFRDPDLTDYRLEWCKTSVRRTVREIFGGHTWSSENEVLVKPSGRAHFGYNRKRLGAMGNLLDLGYLGVRTKYSFILKELAEGRLSEPTLLNWSEECIQPSIPTVILPEWMKFIRREIFQDLIGHALLEVPYCKPLGLAEPLKVRVISKGPPATYAVMHSLQKFMWGILGKCKNFLINRPLSWMDLQLVMKTDRELWISGDYKSATNELNPELSRVFIDEFSKVVGLPPSLEELFYRSMTDHIIMDPEFRDILPDQGLFPSIHELEVKRSIAEPGVEQPANLRKQQWGQLMGSPVSFPVLCVVNAALTRMAIDPEGLCHVSELRALFNGDDVVFAGDKEKYLAWKEITKVGGLSESVGKTYVSPDWLMMNSDMYFPVKDSVFVCGSSVEKFGVHYERVPYVNLALLMGLKRSGTGGLNEDVDDDDEGTLGSRADKLVFGFEDKDIGYLTSRLIAYNRDKLPHYGPWFISEAAGGVGLPCSSRFQPSIKDREIAGLIQSGRLPLPPSRDRATWHDKMIGTELYEQAQREARDLVSESTLESNGHLLTDYYFWKNLLTADFSDVSNLEKRRFVNNQRENYWQFIGSWMPKDRDAVYDPLWKRDKNYLHVNVI